MLKRLIDADLKWLIDQIRPHMRWQIASVICMLTGTVISHHLHDFAVGKPRTRPASPNIDVHRGFDGRVAHEFCIDASH